MSNFVSDFDGFVNPHDFKAHVVVLDDLNPNKIEIETLNRLVDHHEMSYNIKFGPKGRFTNKSIIMATSNYLPKNLNTRRWAVVEYFPYNIEDHVMSMPLEKARQAICDFFECCPDKLDLRKLKACDNSWIDYDAMQYIIDHGSRARCRIKEFTDGDERMAHKIANMLNNA